METKLITRLTLGAFAFFMTLTMSPVRVRAEESGELSNQTQILYNSQNGLPTSESNAVCQTKDGYIWIGSYGGLMRYDGVRFINFSKEKNGIDAAGIRSLYEDEEGTVWIGTNDKGLYSYHNGKFDKYTSDSEDLNSVRCFTQTEDGTLYVGTATGLAKLDGNVLTSLDIPDVNGQTIYTLSTDGNGVVWGTAGEGFAFALQDDRLVYGFQAGELSEYENYAVLADENDIYIGTSANLLIQLTLQDNKYTAASLKQESFDTKEYCTINTLWKTKGGDIWIGTNSGAAYFDADKKLHVVKEISNDTFVNGICEDYEGNIWISTRAGVSKLTHGKFYQANEQAGLAGKAINAVCFLDDNVYAGGDSGLSVIDGDWAPVENALTKMLSGVRIRSLSRDTKGYLWISTYSDYGLIRYAPDTEEILTITQTDGLNVNRVRAVLPLSDGRLAVATTDGVCIIKDMQVTEKYSTKEGLVNGTILCLLEADDGTLLAGSDGDGIYAIGDGKVEHLGVEQGLRSGVVLRMAADKEADGVWISAGSELYFMKDRQITEITAFTSGIGSIFDMMVTEKDIWILKSSGVLVVPREELLAQKTDMSVTEYGMESGLTGDIMANSWNCIEDGMLYICTINGISVLNQKNIKKNEAPPKTAINFVTVTHENGEETVYRNPDSIILASSDKRLSIQFAVLCYGLAPCTVEYYMEGFDHEKTSAQIRETNTASYTNLKGGSYTFRLRATNADGIRNEVGTALHITKTKGLLEYQSVWVMMILIIVLLGVLATRIVMGVRMKKMQKRQQEYKMITDQALRTIANTIDAKDPYTNGHSVRVAGYSREIARRLLLSEEEQEQVYYIALLHDIGKIGIPDAILNKPDKLTNEEYEIMKTHTTIGANILKDFTALPHIGDGAAGHHENFDGTGYPERKKANEQPLVVQIIRVADSYDAMSTKRSYRDPLDKNIILNELKDNSGIEYAPQIERIMEEIIAENFTIDEE
ncbi:MAG: two-component regulator propeller domain-containing protein [Lachnospiraceae bacterium]|nr:two-component regulator propeller domain-containing protein [Lachnospiraceae bacterium]